MAYVDDRRSTQCRDGRTRCDVCGRTFESHAAFERHLKDAGQLW